MRKMRLLALLLCLSLLLPLCPAGAESKPTLHNMAELRDFLDRKTIFLSDRIEFFCSASLYRQIGTSEALRTLMYNYGVLDYYEYHGSMKKDEYEILISEIEYNPGFRAANAFTTVGEHVLTSREKQLLNRGIQIVTDLGKTSPSPGDLAIRIHDYLCRTVTYTPDNNNIWDDENNAMGAIFNGRAECDGYTDAYYLLCRLAGLQVFYQFGDDADPNTSQTHIWNILNLNGRWYHVDVTWDDLDYAKFPDAVTYRYYLIGNEQMKLTHRWNESMCAYPISDYPDWDYGFMYTQNKVGVGAYCGNVKDAGAYIDQCRKAGYKQAHVMVDGRYSDDKALRNAIPSATRSKSWIWRYEMGEYTIFDVYFK